MPDIKLEGLSEVFGQSIDSLTEAIREGKRHSWIRKNFRKGYDIGLSDSDMINDLLFGVLTTQIVYECEVCGRLAIQVGDRNEYKFFSPDTNDTKGILKGG